MPSLGDIANDIEARLDDIKASTHGTQDNTNTIVNELTQLDLKLTLLNSTAQTGFSNLAQGLAILIQLGMQTNDLLAANDRQNQTIICWLDRIAHVLCDIKHDADTEVRLQKKIAATLAQVHDVLERAHPRDALEARRLHELEQRLEECCPRKEQAPSPCFENCASPTLPDYQPVKPDWKPIHFDRPAGSGS